jgi:hypothetical protein
MVSLSGELICATVALGLFPVVMMAAASSAVSGWLEVKGKRVALGHVFAAMAEDTLEGGGKERVEVLLSDKPVPEELRKATDEWSFWAGGQARKGELHGVILYINPETKEWNSGQFLSRRGLMFFSHTVSSPELRQLIFTSAAAAAGVIAGKVATKKAQQGLDESDGEWRVEAEFRCPIIARPAVTGSLTGAAARDSAPYKAVQAYLQACQKKDLDAIKKAVNAATLAELEQMIAAQGKKALLDMLAEATAETLKMTLTKVTVRGDSAEIAFADPKDSSSQQVMNAVLEKGVWKLGQ